MARCKAKTLNDGKHKGAPVEPVFLPEVGQPKAETGGLAVLFPYEWHIGLCSTSPAQGIHKIFKVEDESEV